jgi:hypothetical protein
MPLLELLQSLAPSQVCCDAAAPPLGIAPTDCRGTTPQPDLVWSRLHSHGAGTHALGDVICGAPTALPRFCHGHVMLTRSTLYAGAILNYCKRFAGDNFGTDLSQRRPLFPQDEPALREMNVSDDDAEAIIGYLRLLQRLIETVRA